MSESSRRNFLKTATLGAAAAGVAVVVPFGAESAGATTTSNAPTHAGPVMVWLGNLESGDVTVMAGEHELVHHDPALARQLSQLAARAAK